MSLRSMKGKCGIIMTENIDNLNGVYLGTVSLVCLLTYLAVSRKPAAKTSRERSLFLVLRSYFGSLLKFVHESRRHARIS